MEQDKHSDEQIRKILEMKNVAVIGMSRHSEKAAHFVPKYLAENGFNIKTLKNMAMIRQRLPKWFRKAAEEGDSDAQYSLADLYFGGHGVPRDYIYAHMWLNISAANGDEDAVEFRDQLSARMTQDQIAEAHQLARDCLKRDYKDC